MATIFSLYIVPIFTGMIIVSGVLWIIFLFFYWIPKYLGLGRWFLKRKILFKYRKGFDYSDEIISLCQTAIARDWKFKDMIRITKKSKIREEILYTFIMMMKIKNEWYKPSEQLEKIKSDIKFLEEIVKQLK